MPRSHRRGDCARRERGKVAKTSDGRQTVLADRLQQTHHLDDSIVEPSDFCKWHAMPQRGDAGGSKNLSWQISHFQFVAARTNFLSPIAKRLKISSQHD